MICPHWQYFITLDSDLKETSKYVNIRGNSSTFSIQFVRLLLAAGSEIDVVAKLLCCKIDSSKEYKNIDDYRNAIMTRFPKCHSAEIDIPQYELHLTPWQDWNCGKNPSWWTAYNNVKHHRDSNFKDANLENTINAVAGLFVMILYLHKMDSQKKKYNKPALLSAEKYNEGCEWLEQNIYVMP